MSLQSKPYLSDLENHGSLVTDNPQAHFMQQVRSIPISLLWSTGPPMNQQLHVNFPAQAQFSFNLPAWLMPSSQLLPQFYHQVWKLVEKDKGLVDTARIFPLLLTSGLPTDVLGFIWGLANHKVAGQLTEEELYIVLALVALAQVSGEYPE